MEIMRARFAKGLRKRRWWTMRKRKNVGAEEPELPLNLMFVIGTDEDEALTDGQSAIIFED